MLSYTRLISVEKTLGNSKLELNKYKVNFIADPPDYDLFEALFAEVQLLDLNKDKRIDPRQYTEVE